MRWPLLCGGLRWVGMTQEFGGLKQESKESQRRCAVTGEHGARQELLRFVIGPNDEVVPDLDARLPGRGIWLSPSRDVVKAAVKKNAFAKSIRGRAVVPDDLLDRIEALLVQRCLDGVALARRANQAVAGFEKVKAWLVGGKASLVLAASDGAEDGRGKISNLAGDIPVLAGLTSQELAIPFARGTTVHVAIAPGGLADRLKRDLARLDGLRQPRVKDGPQGTGSSSPDGGK